MAMLILLFDPFAGAAGFNLIACMVWLTVGAFIALAIYESGVETPSRGRIVSNPTHENVEEFYLDETVSYEQEHLQQWDGVRHD